MGATTSEKRRRLSDGPNVRKVSAHFAGRQVRRKWTEECSCGVQTLAYCSMRVIRSFIQRRMSRLVFTIRSPRKESRSLTSHTGPKWCHEESGGAIADTKPGFHLSKEGKLDIRGKVESKVKEPAVGMKTSGSENTVFWMRCVPCAGYCPLHGCHCHMATGI